MSQKPQSQLLRLRVIGLSVCTVKTMTDSGGREQSWWCVLWACVWLSGECWLDGKRRRQTAAYICVCVFVYMHVWVTCWSDLACVCTLSGRSVMAIITKLFPETGVPLWDLSSADTYCKLQVEAVDMDVKMVLV